MARGFYLFFGVLARKIIHQRKLLQSGLSIEILHESAMRRVEVFDDSMASMGKEIKNIELRICHSGLVEPTYAYRFFIYLLETAQAE